MRRTLGYPSHLLPYPSEHLRLSPSVLDLGGEHTEAPWTCADTSEGNRLAYTIGGSQARATTVLA